MVRRLDMHKTQGIEHLFSTGMSKRKIARTLGIDRKSVDRHLAEIQSKGAISQESPIGEAPTGSDASKGAKALTGSEASDLSGIESLKPASKPDRSRSQCSQFKQQILAKIEQGLTSQRIYQDLVSDYGFMAKYHSVRRYVGALLESKAVPVRRMEVAAGQEMQLTPCDQRRDILDGGNSFSQPFTAQRLYLPVFDLQGMSQLTAHLADGFNLSSELQRNGVRECIAKPFSDAARPLSSVILAVVEEYGPKAKTIETPKPAPNVIVREAPVIETKRFSGGELVFKHDRITLCGQTIFYYSRSKQTTRILEALNVKTQTGTWIAKSGPELVDELGSASGQNSITCSIRAFRDSAIDLLKTQLGLICGKQDIISSGGRG
ncbi:MAG: hypothetical protein LW720_18110, partial [Pirellula sp.]|nr:hypothetical protein [Pirellula sp.]